MGIAVLGLIVLPALLWAQELQFQLQPDAFPLQIGNWQPFQPWSGGMEDATPEFCDIDGDSDLDFFCGDQRGYVNYFRNMGSSALPNFEFVTCFFDSLRSAGLPAWGHSDPFFADMDADYDQDAFVASGKILYYQNIGNPGLSNFNVTPDTVYDSSGYYAIGNRVSLADIDADGDLDLFGGRYTGHIRFYENIGAASAFVFVLGDTNWFNTYIGSGDADPCFGDMDDDGDLDLLIGAGDGTIYFYRNDGTAQNAQMSYVTNNYFSIDVDWDASPELADIDGDGDLDLFVGRGHETSVSEQGNISFFENVGTPLQPDFLLRTNNYLIYDSGWAARPLFVDIDADGDPDLFSRFYDNFIFYRNTGSPSAPHFTYEAGFCSNVQVYGFWPWFSDVDRDGDYDLLVGKSNITGIPQIYLYQNRGTPQEPDFVLFTEDLVPGIFETNDVNPNLSMADIDADGDEDLFVSTWGIDFHYFQNNSTPTQIQFQHITSSWQNIIDPSPGSDMYSCFYDMDSDGDLDLFVSNDAWGWQPWDKNLVFYRNVGSSQSAVMQLENDDFFPNFMIFDPAPFLIDMDQDGDGDIFVGDSWGGIRYFKNVTGEPPAVPPIRSTAPYRGPVLSLGPNPANPFVVASFELRVASNMSLEVYDLLGRRVAELASGFHLPGEFRYVWDAGQVAAGMYMLRLRTEVETISEKLVIVK